MERQLGEEGEEEERRRVRRGGEGGEGEEEEKRNEFNFAVILLCECWCTLIRDAYITAALATGSLLVHRNSDLHRRKKTHLLTTLQHKICQPKNY